MHIRATLLLTAFLTGASPTLVSAQAPSDAEMTAVVESYADIAEAAGRPTFLGIGSPRSLFLVFGF